MNRDLQKHKRNDCIKWIAVFLAVILLATGVAAALTQGFKEANPYCWFGHDYDESGKCVRCGEEKPIDEQGTDDTSAHGENMLFATTESHGINLIAEPLQAGSSVPATIAGNSQTLTATITPADAVNKELDWSIAWKNSSSAWATGKSISDYLVLTPTSDGALTATVTCKKDFGEQAIITCKVRTDDTLTATCTVDYKKRVLGMDFSVKITFSNNKVPVDWQFVHTNLNPTVDFITFPSGGDLQEYGLYYGDPYNTTSTHAYAASSGTIDGHWSGMTLSVAPTAEYLAALKAAGFTPAVSAEEYVSIANANSSSFVSLTVDKLILGKFVSGSAGSIGIHNFAEFTKLQTYLREHSSSVMLRFKLEMIGADTSVDKPTIYNVKFSSDSLQVRAQSVSVTNSITF